MKHSVHRSKEGFTLVELLVVVSIIAMLASLLMPAIQSGIEKARRARCMGNLQQIGVAVQQYMADPENQNQFPPIYNVGTSNTNVTGAGSNSPLQPLQCLSNYGATMALLVCPSDNSPDPDYGSYLWSPVLQGEHPQNVNIYRRGGVFTITKLSTMTVCTDKGMPHGGKLNVLRADGHVESKP
jgi:prepilin-type N-terminal cleavage/methylation domain-containing protein/prepilin-type processing-associated H-X9-DG protein